MENVNFKKIMIVGKEINHPSIKDGIALNSEISDFKIFRNNVWYNKVSFTHLIVNYFHVFNTFTGIEELLKEFTVNTSKVTVTKEKTFEEQISNCKTKDEVSAMQKLIAEKLKSFK